MLVVDACAIRKDTRGGGPSSRCAACASHRLASMVGRGVPSGTGENVVWELQVAINRAALANDTSGAWRAFENMWGPGGGCHTTTGEGIQSDGSFHFHGNILYSGGCEQLRNLSVFPAVSQDRPG